MTRSYKDSGWAWIVLLGATLEMALTVGIIKASGVLFVAFQGHFHSTSAMTSLLSTVHNIVYSLCALVVMTVVIKITGSRMLLFVGSFVACTSYVITALATNIRILLLSYGILQGVSFACIMPTVVSTVSQYFEKRRGFANCITVAGSSLGSFVYAPLITKLLSVYGYQGCMLLLGAIMLHGCICGALFRPTSFYEKIKTKGEYSKEMTERLTHEDTCKSRSFSEISRDFDKVTSDHEGSEPLLERTCKVLVRRSSKNEIHGNKEMDQYTHFDESYSEKCAPKGICTHHNRPDLDNGTEDPSKHNEHNVYTNDKDTASKGISEFFKTLGNICDLQVLRTPVFIAFQISSAFLSSGTMLCTIFIAPHAKENGISEVDVAMLVTVFSAVDIFGRITVALISDRKWMRRSSMVAIASLIVSLTAHLLRFYTTFSMLVMYSAILGAVNGVFFSLYAVIIVDYLSLERLQSVLGFTCLCQGFSVAGMFYLVGYLRDTTGSYIVPFHLLGTVVFIGALLMYLLPTIKSRQKLGDSS